MSNRRYGTRILGCGSALPEGVLTNTDLEKLIDTNDEWIAQRTGIRRRHKCDPSKGEHVRSLSTKALQIALDESGLVGSDLDLVIVGTVTGEMTCPSTACRVAEAVGATPSGAFDLGAACSGFVYALNVGESLIQSGRFRTIAVVGCDTLTSIADYTSRRVSILCGDAAGAVVLQRSEDDLEVGCMHQIMESDGSHWSDLYIPRCEADAPDDADWNEVKLEYLQMNGREVYRFAVSTFRKTVERVLDENNLTVDDIAMLIPHQSNRRIIESTMEKLKLPPEKVCINIQNYGNSSAGSVPLCFDQMIRAGRVGKGDKVLFVAFGGGLTWASSLWQL